MHGLPWVLADWVSVIGDGAKPEVIKSTAGNGPDSTAGPDRRPGISRHRRNADRHSNGSTTTPAPGWLASARIKIPDEVRGSHRMELDAIAWLDGVAAVLTESTQTRSVAAAEEAVQRCRQYAAEP